MSHSSASLRCCNLSPRGDGNHHLDEWSCHAIQLQFIPARGRKPLIQIRGHNGFNHVAIYPREGTETRCHDYPRCTGRSCNLSPRGDGNVAPLPFQRPVSRCNLSPRGDGNSTCFCVSVDIAASCNLSPRGDGNTNKIKNGTKKLKLQFIPARGRKRPRPAHPLEGPHLVAIYPREGTETFQNGFHKAAPVRLQFIPARGRKQPLRGRGFGETKVAIYPREGTETG